MSQKVRRSAGVLSEAVRLPVIVFRQKGNFQQYAIDSEERVEIPPVLEGNGGSVFKKLYASSVLFRVTMCTR